MKKQKDDDDALTDCGCDCVKCYCTETACNAHPHCFKSKCNPEKLLDSILRDFRSFVSSDYQGDIKICKELIFTFGKYGFMAERKGRIR